MAAELGAHWQGEEDELVRVTQPDNGYADCIATSSKSNDSLAEPLATVAQTNQQRITLAITKLLEDISKDSRRILPASSTSLYSLDWDQAMLAWRGGRRDGSRAPNATPSTRICGLVAGSRYSSSQISSGGRCSAADSMAIRSRLVTRPLHVLEGGRRSR
jgi:hypothetical protein